MVRTENLSCGGEGCRGVVHLRGGGVGLCGGGELVVVGEGGEDGGGGRCQKQGHIEGQHGQQIHDVHSVQQEVNLLRRSGKPEEDQKFSSVLDTVL